MRKLEGLEACQNCLSRQYLENRGLICKLTGQNPTHEGECADFNLDEEFVRMAPVAEDEQMAQAYDVDRLIAEENLPAGLIAGLVAAVAGAIAWALISVSTGYQIGYMAIGMGFLVGYAVRKAGKGVSQIFGVMGAVLALFGCFLGDYLSMIGYVSKEYGLPYFETLQSVDFSFMMSTLFKNLLSMTALFYGIALFQGYKLSFRLQLNNGGNI